MAELRSAVRLARIVRRTPRLLRVPLGWLVRLIDRIMLSLLIRELPQRNGFRLWIDGPNAAAPAYLRWLQRGITTLEGGCVAIRTRLEAFGFSPQAVGPDRYRRLLLRRQLQLARSLPNMETEALRLRTQIAEMPL